MPLERLHMTTLEVFDSRDAEAVAVMHSHIAPFIPTATDFPYTMWHETQEPTRHSISTGTASELDASQTSTLETIRALPPLSQSRKRARLVKPMLSYDATAVALTFLPAATEDADAYTYHHLRRDMWELLSTTSTTNTTASAAGKDILGAVEVKSRYVVPSAHLTIARNINRWDVKDGESHHEEVDTGKIARFVAALDEINEWLAQNPIAWVIGEEQGLECHTGTSWFGGGECMRLGRSI